MKVSFGRVIPITSLSAPSKDIKTKRVDNSTYEIAKVLNSEKSTVYSKAEAKSIREFFQEILGDYNGKDGILIKRTNSGNTVLLSGEDARKMQGKEIVDGYINTKIENGHTKKKKDSEIILSSSKLSYEDLTPAQKYNGAPIKVKLDRIQYFNTQAYYTAHVDGYIKSDVAPTNSPTCVTKCENIVVNYKELFLN